MLSQENKKAKLFKQQQTLKPSDDQDNHSVSDNSFDLKDSKNQVNGEQQKLKYQPIKIQTRVYCIFQLIDQKNKGNIENKQLQTLNDFLQKPLDNKTLLEFHKQQLKLLEKEKKSKKKKFNVADMKLENLEQEYKNQIENIKFQVEKCYKQDKQITIQFEDFLKIVCDEKENKQKSILFDNQDQLYIFYAFLHRFYFTYLFKFPCLKNLLSGKLSQNIYLKYLEHNTTDGRYRLIGKQQEEDMSNKNYLGFLVTFIGLGVKLADKFSDILEFKQIYKLQNQSNPWYIAFIVIWMISLFAPYLIAYSSGVQLFLSKGYYDESKNQSQSKCVFFIKTCFKYIYITCAGPIYFIALQTLEIILSVIDLLSLFMPQKIHGKLQQLKKDIPYLVFQVSEHDYEGIKDQGEMTQLFFESIPLLILNILILAEGIQVPEMLEDDTNVVLFSIITTSVNLIKQIYLQKIEAKYFQESNLDYALKCITAKINWLPFQKKLIKNPQIIGTIDYKSMQSPMVNNYFMKFFGQFKFIPFEFNEQTIESLIYILNQQPQIEEQNENIEKSKNSKEIIVKEQNLATIHIENCIESIDCFNLIKILINVKKQTNINIPFDEKIDWLVSIKLMKRRNDIEEQQFWSPKLKTGENILEKLLEFEMYPVFIIFLQEYADPNTLTLGGDPLILHFLKQMIKNEISQEDLRDDKEIDNIQERNRLRDMYKMAIEELSKDKYGIQADQVNPLNGHSVLSFLIEHQDIQLFKKFYKSDKHKEFLHKVQKHGQFQFTPFSQQFSVIYDQKQETKPIQFLNFFKEQNLTIQNQIEENKLIFAINQKLLFNTRDLYLHFIPKDKKIRDLKQIDLQTGKKLNIFQLIWKSDKKQERLRSLESLEENNKINPTLYTDSQTTLFSLFQNNCWAHDEDSSILYMVQDWYRQYQIKLEKSDEFLLVDKISKSIIQQDKGVLNFWSEKVQDWFVNNSDCTHESINERIQKTFDLSQFNLQQLKFLQENSKYIEDKVIEQAKIKLKERTETLTNLQMSKSNSNSQVLKFNDIKIESKNSQKESIKNTESNLINNDSKKIQIVKEVKKIKPIQVKKQKIKKFFSKDSSIFMVFIHLVLEILALVDQILDIVVLKQLIDNGHSAWTAITILCMSSSYFISYTPIITMFLLRETFQKQNKNDKVSIFRKIMGWGLISPLGIVYLFLIDLIYIIFGITSLSLQLLIAIITCGKVTNLFNGEDFLDGIFQKLFNLNKMDVSGLRSLRTFGQMVFESVPQLVLQIRMLNYGVKGMDANSLLISVISAGVHMCLEIFIFVLESQALKSSLLKYAVQCLNGRLNWVPFIDSYQKCDQVIDYNKIESKKKCLKIEIDYTFYQPTLQSLKYFLAKLPMQENHEMKKKILIAYNLSDQIQFIDIYELIYQTQGKVDIGLSYQQQIPQICDEQEQTMLDKFYKDRIKNLNTNNLDQYINWILVLAQNNQYSVLEQFFIYFQKIEEVKKLFTIDMQKQMFILCYQNKYYKTIEVLLKNDFSIRSFDGNQLLIDRILYNHSEIDLLLILLKNTNLSKLRKSNILIKIVDRYMSNDEYNNMILTDKLDENLKQDILKLNQIIFLTGGLYHQYVSHEISFEHKGNIQDTILQYRGSWAQFIDQWLKQYKLNNQPVDVKHQDKTYKIKPETLESFMKIRVILCDKLPLCQHENLDLNQFEIPPEFIDLCMFLEETDIGSENYQNLYQKIQQDISLYDNLVEYLQMDHDLQLYLNKTKDLRKIHAQEGTCSQSYNSYQQNRDKQYIQDQFDGRNDYSETVLKIDLPENKKLIALKSVKIQGIVRDQGWGNTGQTFLGIVIKTKYDQFKLYTYKYDHRVQKQNMSQHFELDKTYNPILLDQQVQTMTDIQLILRGVLWGGHQQHVQNLKLNLEFWEQN